MSGDISVHALKKVHEDRKQCQLDTYRRIYSQCCQKINTVNKYYYAKKCTFHVPVMLWGYPLYSLKECVIFISYRLRKKGFQTYFTYPNVLNVSWESIVDSSKKSSLPPPQGYSTSPGMLTTSGDHHALPIEYSGRVAERWDSRLIAQKNDRYEQERRLRKEERRRRRKHKKHRHRRHDEKRESIDRERQRKKEQIDRIIREKIRETRSHKTEGHEEPERRVLEITT